MPLLEGRLRVAREQVAAIRSLTAQIDALKRELRALIEAQRPELLAEVARISSGSQG
jgi:hypothetical protein